MGRDELFHDLPTQAGPERPRGRPRLLEPQRDQLELRQMDVESLIGEDHRARVIWGYVERLDLQALEDAVRAREGEPGHPAISPRLLLGLWLYATSEGVGSARALARLCESHDAYRWMCGGVSVNYHTLSDFRVGNGDLLDRLLSENVAALAAAGVIDLGALTQDGIKVRASAGAGSFRRRGALEGHLAAARSVVAQLKREVEEDADASNRRIRAARARAARERLARIEAGMKALQEVAARREARKQNRPKDKPKPEPRASSTDPHARVMKMPDGGFRPAFNIQVVSTAGEQIVLDVDVGNVGSDRGLMRPGMQAARRRTGHLPARYLADGGFTSAKDIEWAHREDVAVYCPPSGSKHGGDRFAPRRDDGPGVHAWRLRMASDEGKAWYKTRAIGECIHARWRHWDLVQVTVRRLDKVRSVALWYALTNNILQGHRLMKQSA
jgi:transposase